MPTPSVRPPRRFSTLRDVVTHVVANPALARGPGESIPLMSLNVGKLSTEVDGDPITPAQPNFDHQSLPGAPIDSSKPPVTTAPTEIDQNTAFWETYNKTGNVEDKEFVETSGRDLNGLLIFAGLFSATNTAFIIESCKNLKADPVEETNKLLRSVFSATINPSNATLDTTPFVVDHRDIRINACFFTSLCCSLSAAFGAVLAMQWLTQYDRDGGGSMQAPAARGQERQRKFEGRDKWHLEDVIVALPTLLQLSLFFFLVGLVDLLWPLNGFVTGIIFAFTLATFLFYIITIIISVADESAPFQTTLSPHLRSPLPRIWKFAVKIAPRLAKLRESHTRIERSAYIACVSYLLERVTEPKDLKIVAEAFTSLEKDPDVATITAPFIDFHFKPIPGQSWGVPSLYGPARSSLLKIFNILAKDWRGRTNPTIRTPLYSLDTTTLFPDLPGELRKAFLADPTDTDSCSCIVSILLTLDPVHPSTPSNQTSEGMVGWRQSWFEEDVTKHLDGQDGPMKGPEHKDAAARNTLTMLNMATWGYAERGSAWGVVKDAKCKNPRLKSIIHSMLWKEISTFRSEETPYGPVGFPRILDWLTVSGDMDGLAEALEALPRNSEGVVVAAQPLIGTLVETLVTLHLQPRFDGWWHLPGLHTHNRRPLLRILRIIIVKWRYLEAGVNIETPSFQLLHSLVSSLRAELWEAFLAEPEDVGAVRLIADICKVLPTPASFIDDEISTTAMRKLCAEMSTVLRDTQANPTTLQNCFTLLCANANSLISFANFHSVRVSPLGSRAVPNYLRSSTWNRDKTADLEDFWKGAFRVQLLPRIFPMELGTLKFVKYLALWFRRYTKHDAEIPADAEPPQQSIEEVIQQKRLYWVYLLSLRHLLTNTEAPRWATELKDHGHLSSLLEIIDSGLTMAPLALHLFLCLWANGLSDDPLYVTARGIKGVMNALASENIPLGLMSLEMRMYAEGCREGDVSHEKWSDEVSEELMRDMGQMMQWLHSYLELAIQRGLIDENSLDHALGRYESWSVQVGGHLRSGEFKRLSEELGKVGRSFKAQKETVRSQRNE